MHVSKMKIITTKIALILLTDLSLDDDSSAALIRVINGYPGLNGMRLSGSLMSRFCYLMFLMLAKAIFSH
jgi:hypothetical protein